MFKRALKYFAPLFLFWMSFFAIERLLFLFYNMDNSGLSFAQLLEPFFRAIRLDISTVCYLISPLYLLWIIHLFFPIKQFRLFHKIYFLTFIPILAFGLVVGLEIYHEWGYKMNRDVVSYIQFPKESWASSLNSPLWLLFGIYSIYTLVFLKWGLRIANRCQNIVDEAYEMDNKWIVRNISVAILSIFLFGISLRGGFQQAPINQSFANYSTNPTLNAATVNTVWNLIYSYSREVHKNPYKFFTKDEINVLVKTVENKNSFPKIFTGNNHNIVLLVLESMASEMFKNMGSKNKFTVNMDGLISNGLLFNNIYGSEKRTDRGIVSILSGYPSLPLLSVVKQPDKSRTLSFLPKRFKQIGYETSFIYGGESEFANMKSYLLNAGFNHIIDKNNFEQKDMNSKWGAHDHVVFNRALTEIKQMREPFFTTVLTLSSHEPFDVPMAPVFKGNDRQTLYKNSVIYLDRSLGDFMSAISKEPYYNNTIFIFIADHGFRVGDAINWYPRRHGIPLFIYGKPLKKEWRGKVVSDVGSQTDLAKTILDQFDMDTVGFGFSRNLLAGSAGSAFYTFNHGFGWIEEHQSLVYDHELKTVTYFNDNISDSTNNHLLNKGRAYLQNAYQDFIDR